MFVCLHGEITSFQKKPFAFGVALFRDAAFLMNVMLSPPTSLTSHSLRLSLLNKLLYEYHRELFFSHLPPVRFEIREKDFL